MAVGQGLLDQVAGVAMLGKAQKVGSQDLRHHLAMLLGPVFEHGLNLRQAIQTLQESTFGGPRGYVMPKVVTAQVLRFNEELVDELLGQVPVAAELL